MSDIVERLRIRQPLLGKLCDEAADEIERLKAALREIAAYGPGSRQASIARAALEKTP